MPRYFDLDEATSLLPRLSKLMAEVIQALLKATGFEAIRCAKTTMEAHIAGRAIVTRTDEESAERIVAELVRADLLAAVRPA